MIRSEQVMMEGGVWNRACNVSGIDVSKAL